MRGDADDAEVLEDVVEDVDEVEGEGGGHQRGEQDELTTEGNGDEGSEEVGDIEEDACRSRDERASERDREEAALGRVKIQLKGRKWEKSVRNIVLQRTSTP